MVNRAKAALPAVMSSSGIIDAYIAIKKLSRPQIVILLYHLVTPDRGKGYLADPLDPRLFESQIENLSRKYELISLDSLAGLLRERKGLPEKAVVITFDDGYRDNYLHAFPILKKYHVPATMFIATGHIGARKMLWYNRAKYIFHMTDRIDAESDAFGRLALGTENERLISRKVVMERLKRLPYSAREEMITELSGDLGVDIPENFGEDDILFWDEVREMDSDGILFGAHTVNHPILTSVSLEDASWEITQSKKDLENELGHNISAFAYPNGGLRDFNRRIAALVRESGFSCAVATIPRWINSKSDLYKLGRIKVVEDENAFKVLFSGLYADTGLYRLLG